MLREKFPEFCSSPSPPIEGNEEMGGDGGPQRCCARARLRAGLQGELYARDLPSSQPRPPSAPREVLPLLSLCAP